MDMVRTKNEPRRDAEGFRLRAPKVLFPEVAVTINGDLGAKNWRDPDSRGCITQYLTIDERREVVRRANAYLRLVNALRKMVRDEQKLSLAGPIHGNALEAQILLEKLGEEI